MSKKKQTKKKVATKKKSTVKKKAAAKKNPIKKKAAPKKKAAVKKKGSRISGLAAAGGCSVRCLVCRRVIGNDFTEDEAKDFRTQHSQANNHPVDRIRIICSQ